MANIKWSGIESWKYKLTARWYVDLYYGNDVDIDAVGYYNPTTNPQGHGGPTRPFCSEDKIQTDANVLANAVVVYSAGNYRRVGTLTKGITRVADGNVIFDSIAMGSAKHASYGINHISCSFTSNVAHMHCDCYFIYCNAITNYGAGELYNNIYIESSFISFTPSKASNLTFINCSGPITIQGSIFHSIFFINCANLIIATFLPRGTGTIVDYSIIIGTVKSNRAVNGKATGVTIEDFKTDGNYFVKSFSEVDLFGNASGSGASVAQLQTIFNNYFSPIYLDTWQDVDLSLKPDVSDIVKFGGLNGTYIGALPVGYRYSAYDLYNTYIDAVNSSNLSWNAVNNAIVIADGFDTAVYRSIRITLPVAISCDPINFFANLVYNIEGTAKQGVANQRIDTTPDLEPNNTLNQRVVYDFKLAYSANDTDPLSDFKNFELNSVPYIDNEGESMLDDNYDPSERQKPLIRSFMIEFTLRKIIIA